MENIGLRGRKPRWTIRDTNLLLRLVKSKRKITFKKLCSKFNHSRTQKFSQTIIRSYLRRTGFRRRVLKKNILIRPANRKKRINFCKEKRDWTIEDWKNVVFSDETMVVIGNDRKIHIWRRSDENHAPYLICSEDRNRIAVMFWGFVSSRGVGA